MAVDHVSGASVAADGAIDPATGIAVDMAQRNNKRGDASQPPPPAKKRRRSRGPAQAARHAAFLASRQQDAADDAQAQMETDARGGDGEG